MGSWHYRAVLLILRSIDVLFNQRSELLVSWVWSLRNNFLIDILVESLSSWEEKLPFIMLHKLLLLLEFWKLFTLLQGWLVQFLELLEVRNPWALGCLCSIQLRDDALGVFNNFINSNLWLSSTTLTRFCISTIKEKVRSFFLALILIVNELL